MALKLRGNHSVHELYAHLVFVTKYRRKALNSCILQEMYQVFLSVSKELDFQIAEFDGEEDHVHMLIQYRPNLLISDIVQRLKGRSSYELKKKFPVLKRYFWKKGIWSPSYFAGSCGGAPVETIRKYIENQNTPY